MRASLLGGVFVVVVGCYGHGETPPGGGEICGDRIDNNGNGEIDEGCNPTGALVGDLTTSSQIDLCNDFVINVCANTTDPSLDGFCGNSCITNGTSCTDAASALTIDAECASVTVDQVEQCFATGDVAICMEGGGLHVRRARSRLSSVVM